MVEKTVKQIIEENKGKEIYLLDEAGIWGELPLTENNLQHTPNAVEINDYVVRIYIGWNKDAVIVMNGNIEDIARQIA